VLAQVLPLELVMAVTCPYCNRNPISESSGGWVRKNGQFKRKSDGVVVHRFLCSCKKSFSEATSDPWYRQKKRHLNFQVVQELASGRSQRKTAYVLKINKNTVVRKFILLGARSHATLLENNRNLSNLIHNVEFDEMETSEHSKMKPLSIHLAIESKSRRILNFKVSSMPCKGNLANKSVLKYGPRLDERPVQRLQFFEELRPFVSEHATFKSDMNPHYPKALKKVFPNSQHVQTKGRRGRNSGFGELKMGGWDPIFTFNHTAAMHRENINRLIRQTWSTTKKKERLAYHLGLYALFHNQEIITGRTKKALAHQGEFSMQFCL